MKALRRSFLWSNFKEYATLAKACNFWLAFLQRDLTWGSNVSLLSIWIPRSFSHSLLEMAISPMLISPMLMLICYMLLNMFNILLLKLLWKKQHNWKLTFLVLTDRSTWSKDVAIQGWKCKTWLNNFFWGPNQTICMELRLNNNKQARTLIVV